MSDHYKSQITDDEVIKELIRDSKKREGKLPTEVIRLKPNLNFFQRTVSSLVSNNTRIDKTQDTFKNEFLKDPNEMLPETSENGSNSPPKSSIDYAFEREISLQKKINFVKSLDTYSSGLIKPKAKIQIKKINFVGASTNMSNRQLTSNISEKKSQKIEQKVFNISSDSEEEEDKPSNDLNKIICSDDNKTTCKTYPSKSESVKSSNVVLILSDSETVEVVSSSDSDGEKTNKKIKKQIKKRKKEKKNEKLVEESEKSVKRKKPKKKKYKNKDRYYNMPLNT